MADLQGGSTRLRVGRYVPFAAATAVLALVAHAVAYLTHEYSHSLMAWSLGWMAEPFGINYGPASPANLVLLGSVEDNVDYDRLFAHGAGLAATVIALAGPFLGNGLLYLLLQPVLRMPWVASRQWLLGFVYWLSLMCAGNIFSYVPVRAIATHGDIGLAARGLGVSPWLLFPVLMAISAWFLVHFFTRTFPRCAQGMTQGDPVRCVVMVAITAFWYFVFFGMGGINGSYGPVSLLFSVASMFLLYPLCVAWLWWHPAGPAGPSREIS